MILLNAPKNPKTKFRFAPTGAVRGTAVYSAPEQQSVQNFRVLPVAVVAAANLVLRDASKMVNELSLDEGTYEMANLRERTTGLPFVVFVSQKGKAQHPCRVKISKEPQTANFFASVSVNNPVEVKSGHVRADDMELLKKWILLNQEALLQYWDGNIQYTEDLLEKLKPV